MADNDWKSRLNVVYSTNPDFEYETEAPENIPTLPPQQQEGDQGQQGHHQGDSPGGGVAAGPREGQPPQGLPQSVHRGGNGLVGHFPGKGQGQHRSQQGKAQGEI